jgi:hypothetical protein
MASASDDISLKGRDWLFVLFLLAMAAYVALLILAFELSPEAFAAGVALLDVLPLDPFRLAQLDCAPGEPGPGLAVIQRINLAVLPMLAVGIVYNTVDLRRRAEPLPVGNWLLSLISIALLPALLATACPSLWQDKVPPLLAEGITFAHAHTAAAAIYALVLLSLCNSVSLIPAALLRWVVPRRKVEVEALVAPVVPEE